MKNGLKAQIFVVLLRIDGSQKKSRCQVTASAENAQVTVLQANRENGLKAQIFVTAKDTGAVQTYVVQFQEESPQIERLELRLPEGQELKEDQTVPLEVIAHYQDGSQASLKADQIDVKTRAGSQGKAVATNKGLELREAGLVHLEANFQGQTGEVSFTITPNPEEKTVVKVRPVRISTDRNVLPALPETVLVEYDKGFPKEKRVTWDAVTADQVKDYHSFTVTGHVEGVEKEAQAQVTVEGIIAVEEVSTTTPVGEKPALPESVRTYHSNGKTYAAKVAWDAVDPQLLAQEGEVVLSACHSLLQVTLTMRIQLLRSMTRSSPLPMLQLTVGPTGAVTMRKILLVSCLGILVS